MGINWFSATLLYWWLCWGENLFPDPPHYLHFYGEKAPWITDLIYAELITNLWFSSVQSLSHVRLFATPWTTAHQASLSITNSWSLLNSCPLSGWCHPTISSSVVPFSSCPQSLPASESFPKSQLFAWGGQSIGVSASASVLEINTYDWYPLGWTG